MKKIIAIIMLFSTYHVTTTPQKQEIINYCQILHKDEIIHRNIHAEEPARQIQQQQNEGHTITYLHLTSVAVIGIFCGGALHCLWQHTQHKQD